MSHHSIPANPAGRGHVHTTLRSLRCSWAGVARLISACLVLTTFPAGAELLVSSFTGNRVLRYSESNGAFIGTFISASSGGLNLPHGLAVGPDGHIYVASAGNDSVLRFNQTNGSFIDTFVPAGAGGLDYPVTLLFRPDGLLYVSSQLNNRVLRFDATTGAFVDEFVSGGSGGLNGPSGMVFAPDGSLLVVGRFGNHVLRYRGSDGAFVEALVPAGVGGLSQPFGCAFGPDGHLLVVSGNDGRVARFHGGTGIYLGDFIAPGSGGLSLPVGAGFGPDGNFYVASFSNQKIARYNGATGAFLNNFVPGGSGGLSGPNFFLFRPAQTVSTNIPGIGPLGPVEQRHLGFAFTEGPAADANGNVFFTDVQNQRIHRSDTTGLLSVFLTNSRACNGLMFDQAGRLVACQRDERRIIAIDVTTRSVTVLASNVAGRAFIGPNDLVIDRTGGVYFSDPNFSANQTGATQAVYYASAGGLVTRVLTNIARPNGVILSIDETKLYVMSSVAAQLLTYPLLSPGVPGTPVATPLPGTGDGLTIDTDGNLYLAQPSRSNILVLSPAGIVRGTIRVPERPSNCTFGGADMQTLFITAGTSVYTCRMSATGHRFAWNPGSYAAFQTKFFGGTNAPGSGPDEDPDDDGSRNELEYLIRTHPLAMNEPWTITLQAAGGGRQISFPQIAGRGFEVEGSPSPAAVASWQPLAVPGNPLPVSSTNRTATLADPTAPGTHRFYRVRVYEP